MPDKLHDVTVNILETGMCAPGDLEAACDVLSDDELARFQRFHFDEDRNDYALAHALLRRTLSDREPSTDPHAWRFEADATGKPRITGRAGPDFSLTHTRGLVACAVAVAGRVGIDAETDSRSADVDLLMPEVCAPPERAALAALAGAARRSRFLDFWTLKEAYLKAQGLGISENLTAIAFFVKSDTDIRLETFGGGHRADWSLRIFRIGAGGRVALALDRDLDALDFEVRILRDWRG